MTTHAAKLASLVLQQVAKVLDKLTEEQLADLAEGRAHVEFRSQDTVISAGRVPTAKKSTVDIDGAVLAIKAMATSNEVRNYLEAHDKPFTLAVLRDIARGLGSTVSSTAKSKAAMKANIVEGTVGFRERSNAVFEGGWQR